MASSDLNFLDPQEQALVRQMIAAVADHSEMHVNRIRVSAKPGGSFSYFVGQSSDARGSALTQRQVLPVNIAPPMVGHGWMVAVRSQAGFGVYEFTQHALDWYRANSGPTDHEIRERLGRYLYRRFEENPDRLPEFDLDRVAEELGLPAEEIDLQARLLKRLGLAEASIRTRVVVNDTLIPPIESNEHLLRLRLTNEGIRWAVAGFTPITMGQTTNVNVSVDLHVQVQAVINQAREADVPQELLDRIELLMRRIEEEIEKPRGSYEPVKDAIETAAHTKELMGPLVGFLARNWHRIQGLAEATGDAIGDAF